MTSGIPIESCFGHDGSAHASSCVHEAVAVTVTGWSAERWICLAYITTTGLNLYIEFDEKDLVARWTGHPTHDLSHDAATYMNVSPIKIQKHIERRKLTCGKRYARIS